MTQDPGAPSPLDDPILGSPGYLLLKAGHYIRLAFEEGLAALDLNAREMLVLSFVETTPGLSQQQLAARLGLDPTIVVGLVDGLEERRLLERRRDPEDRRRNVLTLTAKGTKLRARAIRAAESIQDDFLGSLSPTERDQLASVLGRTLTPHLAWLR